MKRLLFSSLTFVWLTSSALTLTPLAHADDGCANPKTPYDSTYCLAKLFLESDKELNEVYKNLRSALKEPAKKSLTGVQRQWIQYRDASCSVGTTINVDCNYKVNTERAEYLRDRLRECKTGHCQDDKIGAISWTAPAK